MPTSRELTRPTVHLNGTSREELQRQLEEAGSALQIAMTALCAATPNARDYYPQGSAAVTSAIKEHVDRYGRLKSVHDELMDLYEGLLDA